MHLRWDDVALHTTLKFEAQVRYGEDGAWRTVGVTHDWAAADAMALTAAADEQGRAPTAHRVVVVGRTAGC